jgi:hypothetical protein
MRLAKFLIPATPDRSEEYIEGLQQQEWAGVLIFGIWLTYFYLSL